MKGSFLDNVGYSHLKKSLPQITTIVTNFFIKIEIEFHEFYLVLIIRVIKQVVIRVYLPVGRQVCAIASPIRYRSGSGQNF